MSLVVPFEEIFPAQAKSLTVCSRFRVLKPTVCLHSKHKAAELFLPSFS